MNRAPPQVVVALALLAAGSSARAEQNAMARLDAAVRPVLNRCTWRAAPVAANGGCNTSFSRYLEHRRGLSPSGHYNCEEFSLGVLADAGFITKAQAGQVLASGHRAVMACKARHPRRAPSLIDSTIAHTGAVQQALRALSGNRPPRKLNRHSSQGRRPKLDAGDIVVFYDMPGRASHMAIATGRTGRDDCPTLYNLSGNLPLYGRAEGHSGVRHDSVRELELGFICHGFDSDSYEVYHRPGKKPGGCAWIGNGLRRLMGR